MPRTQAFEHLGYVPAELHLGAITYIDYYVREPITSGKKRIRIKLNHIAGRVARRSYGRQLVNEINLKLSRGWNPLVVSETTQSWYTMEQVLEHFMAVKQRDTNHSSPKTYTSFTNIFRRWCRREGVLNKGVTQFTRSHALRFLDHLLDERKVGDNTYNNYMLRASIFFIWAIDREYRTDNPFKGIRRKRKAEKFRTLISEEERAQCLNWFERYDPPMVLVCLFVFHTLLRPRSELMRIRIKDLDLVNGVINVSGSDSKGRRIRRPAIPDVMMPFLKASPIMAAKSHEYVVGRGLLPGPVHSGHNTTGNRWNAMRDALGWPADKTLYSLRDSGIVQLIADGIDLTHVMQQAGHRDIATTNIYVQHYFPNGLAAVRKRATAFRTLPEPQCDPTATSSID